MLNAATIKTEKVSIRLTKYDHFSERCFDVEMLSS